MIDKQMKNVYFWYSGATDVTGMKLVKALGASGGRKVPDTKKVCAVIGWGVKNSENVKFPEDLPFMNHPNNIRLNRNKYEALRAMSTGGVKVAPFVLSMSVDEAIKDGDVKLPLIGRRKFHQGGKGFWHCPTRSHVKAAIREGAEYFQNLIEIADEYRLHTFKSCGVIHAVKKIQRTKEEMAEAFIRHELERQKNLAEKNNNPFDEATAKLILERQARKYAADGANMLIRSNRMGWKFVRSTDFPKALETEAIRSLSSIGLDFGAVDCCTDVNGDVWIIEVNTGPGLEGTAFNRWIAVFKDKIENLIKPKPVAEQSEKKVVNDKSVDNGIKSGLMEKIELVRDMVDNAENEEEAAALERVFKRMFA
jgi:hypothetical protein